jgi:hypothetical protein
MISVMYQGGKNKRKLGQWIGCNPESMILKYFSIQQAFNISAVYVTFDFRFYIQKAGRNYSRHHFHQTHYNMGCMLETMVRMFVIAFRETNIFLRRNLEVDKKKKKFVIFEKTALTTAQC